MTITTREMKELSGQCCQDNCEADGTHRMYWPGQPAKRVCSEHAQKAVAIAMAMGFHLVVEEIENNDRP